MNEFSVGGEVVVRLVAASILGGLIGLEREIDDQAAGLRTHLSVALGAAVFGVISTLGFVEFADRTADTNFRVDVTRVASQVAAGVGFLGAGVIFRQGASVRNLTTAASLWVVAAIGLTAGVGNIGIAGVASAALLVALVVLRIPRDWVRGRYTRHRRELRVGMVDGVGADSVLAEMDRLVGVTAELVGLEKIDGTSYLRIAVTGEPGHSPERAVAPLVSRPDVASVRFTDEA